MLAFSILCFAIIEITQFVLTGSFDRGEGFIAGRYLALPMLYSCPAGLILLLVGAVIDSTRFTRVRNQPQPADQPPARHRGS